MAEEQKKTEKVQKVEKHDKLAKFDKQQEKSKSDKDKRFQKEDLNEILVRIAGYDMRGSRQIYTGLTRIKGVSWAISNVICLKVGIPKNKKVSELSKDEIAKIEAFLKKVDVPDYLKNRRSDIDSGETKHYTGSDLDIKREFDIKRLREIKSYKGIRHSAKLPVRGQRTRSHFRKKGISMGVKRKAK